MSCYHGPIEWLHTRDQEKNRSTRFCVQREVAIKWKKQQKQKFDVNDIWHDVIQNLRFPIHSFTHLSSLSLVTPRILLINKFYKCSAVVMNTQTIYCFLGAFFFQDIVAIAISSLDSHEERETKNVFFWTERSQKKFKKKF